MTSMKKTLIVILTLTIATLALGIYLFIYSCKYYESIPDTEVYNYTYEDYVSDYYKERLAEIKREHEIEEQARAEELEEALKTLQEIEREKHD